MTAAAIVQVSNRLFDGLPRRDREGMLDRCESVDLTFDDTLCEPDTRFEHVYFPLKGIISLVVSVNRHPPLEMGLIGNEGMLGATLALGIRGARLRGVVQSSGTALRMTARQFQREIRDRRPLQRTINRYLYVLLSQLSQSAACTRFHQLEARLARGLLLMHDRVHADHFRLTHQYLAHMLGVQRSAVTIAAGALQRGNLIRYMRGKITILDRKGLEAVSCECYAAATKDYRQILG